MEININEYIRTEEGFIGKVKRIEVDKLDKSLKWYVFDKKRYDMNIVDEVYINKPYIKKHSFNIIDLIEKGDYVNGFLIDYINLDCKVPFLRSERPYREETTWYKDLIEKGKDYNMCLHFKQEDIKSIVTKEQFRNVEYEV